MPTESGTPPSRASTVVAWNVGVWLPPGHTLANARSESTRETDIAASGSHRHVVRARRDIGAITAKVSAGSSGMRSTQATRYPFSLSRRSNSTVRRAW